MKDIFGTPIQHGDEVAFNPPSYKGLIKGVVVAFTPKMVRVSYEWNRELTTTVVYPADIAVNVKTEPIPVERG